MDEDYLVDDKEFAYEEQVDGQEQYQEQADPSEEQTHNTTDSYTKRHAHYLFSAEIKPRELSGDGKSRPVSITIDHGIKLLKASHPSDFIKKKLVLPCKVSVANVTSNYFKNVQLRFKGIHTQAYQPDHLDHGHGEVAVVVRGAPTVVSTGFLKREVILESEVKDNMKRYIDAYPDYDIDNLRTKGVEKTTRSVLLPGPDGWEDEEGVKHGVHPIYDFVLEEQKKHEEMQYSGNSDSVASKAVRGYDDIGRMMIDKKEFDRLADEAIVWLKGQQRPWHIQKMEIEVTPFGMHSNGDLDWSSESGLTLPAEDIDRLSKRTFNITGDIYVEYHGSD